MMKDFIEITPAKNPINAEIAVPGSKSITNRALLLAAMAKSETRLKNVLFSDDTRAFMDCLRRLGFEIFADEAAKTARIAGGTPKNAEINARSAGTAARFLSAYLSANEGTFSLDASAQMKKRPMEPLFAALSALGADITYLGEKGRLPVRIAGRTLPGGEVRISPTFSSQFVSALLMTAPLYKNGLKIIPEGSFSSLAYVEMTIRMMRRFGVEVDREGESFIVAREQGYEAREYEIESDVSSACYFYAAAALTGGTVLVHNIYADSMQGDIRFLDVLHQMGAKYEETQEGIRLTGPPGGELYAVDVNLNGMSDQTMTLSAIAPFAKGSTRITGVKHIRLQECDRIAAIVAELTRLGITARELEDGVVIQGEGAADKIIPAAIETYDDHRMAMAFALTGLRAPGIEIKNPSCCAKTFEGYFDVFDLMLYSPPKTSSEKL